MADIILIERIEKKIFLIRGKKVMVDRDLAMLYQVPTKVMNQAVKRNLLRFPEDFMFQLTAIEMENWKSQFVTSNSGKMGLRKKPYAFTENGIAMLSSVLKSKKAIFVNIQIMRTFTQLRETQENQKHVITQLNRHEVKLLHHDRQIAEVFQTLDTMREPQEVRRKRKIGFIPSGK